MLRIGYKDTRKAWKSELDKGATFSFIHWSLQLKSSPFFVFRKLSGTDCPTGLPWPLTSCWFGPVASAGRRSRGKEEWNQSICSLAFFPVGLLHVGTAAATTATDITEMLVPSHFRPWLLPPLLGAPPGTERKRPLPFFYLLICLPMQGPGTTKGARSM